VGEPKVDWGSWVNYQEMPWDRFATERPADAPMDFRVAAEEDHFFSHEFADSTVWSCFRLTAPQSGEALFGYAKSDSPACRALQEIIKTDYGGKAAAVILRLTVPAGLKSRSGVIIDQVRSPRWFYLDSPED